ncbi:MAG: 4Fe-4S binding protein [Firmicutes bacterium]|nr:4Fe-4S binding protein [Bacillota bacterium]
MPVIDADLCTGCNICVDECPTDSLELNAEDIADLVRPEDCDGEEECGTCSDVCPFEAISYKPA